MELVKLSDVAEKLRNSSLPHLNDEMMEKCALMCNMYSLSVDDLLNKLDAFLVTQDLTKFEKEHVGKFEQDVRSTTAGTAKLPIRDRNAKSDSKSQELARSRDIPHMSSQSPELKRKAMPVSNTPVSKQRSTPDTPDSQMSAGSQSSPSSGLELLLAQGGGGGPTGLFQTRDNVGKQVLQFNPQLSPRDDGVSYKKGASRCRVQFTDPDEFDNVTQRYRYMFTTLEERARALDGQLLRLQADMCAALGLTEEELAPVGLPSPEVVWTCGRVCNEAPSGKLNATAVVLEGSRVHSGGRRAELDLRGVPSFALFPGQIVLVRGINSSGRKMVVEKIVEGMQKKLASSPAKKLAEFHHSQVYQQGQALSVVVAAGPFTTADNLEYEPLEELLSNVATAKPDVLVLMGPFVDSSHALLQGGDATLITRGNDGTPVWGSEHSASYEMVFIEKVIRDGLGTYFNSEGDFGGWLPTQIILVPSLLDAHHECVFPQPPFGDRDTLQTSFFKEPLGSLAVPHSSPKDPSRRVFLAPNPCMFRVNEVLFGVTSNDTLFALSSDGETRDAGQGMCRMAGHMLQQQSFSPSFPAPPSTLAQLDLRHSKHWTMDVSPDILLTPSRLAPMAKEVLGTLVVNPGPLAKGVNGGSFASLSIHPLPAQEAAAATSDDSKGEQEAGLRTHDVAARTHVKICKI